MLLSYVTFIAFDGILLSSCVSPHSFSHKNKIIVLMTIASFDIKVIFHVYSFFICRSGATGCSAIAPFGILRRLARITESGEFVKLGK